MPRTNPLSRRLAAAQHQRQLQLLRHVDAGSVLVDRAVASVWAELLAVIRTTDGYERDLRRALAVLRTLPGRISGTLSTRLEYVYRQAHRGAGLSVVEAAPRRVSENVVDPDGVAVLLDAERRHGDRGAHPSLLGVPQGDAAVELMEDETGAEDLVDRLLVGLGAKSADAEPRDLFASLVLGPPSEESSWRALAPLVRMEDWTAIGEVQRKLPWELAAQIAGGMSQGKTQQQIALEIRPFLDGSRVRARRAARTFGLVIAHEAQHDAWAGIDHLTIGWEVHATLDQHTRPEHRKRDGNKYYKRPGPGQMGLDVCPRPPREYDGTIAWNCRCWTSPILAPL